MSREGLELVRERSVHAVITGAAALDRLGRNDERIRAELPEESVQLLCVTDGSLAEATANIATPEVQYLVIGSPDLAMPDNIAYQPGRGNWIIHEDGDGPDVGRNNDLWSCRDDGEDADTLSDGCVRIATLNDLNAEWTGGIFDATGTRFFVSVQYNVTGHGVILEITGWR